jgi:hypothetical protein
MGQRHQVYVVAKKNNQYQALGGYHHQWCYGMRAVTNATRAIDIIEKTNKSLFDGDSWTDYYCESRVMRSIITAAFGVDIDGRASIVHDDGDYLIENSNIMPSRGDNNDGCTLIVIDLDKSEARLGFFTPGHIEGEHWTESDGVNKVYSREKYLSFYYSKATQNTTEFKETFAENFKVLDKKVKPVTQSELNKILKYEKTQSSHNKGA